jgi:DNA-binding MarR family transcriptional regulator
VGNDAVARLMAAMRRASAIGVIVSQTVAQKAGLNTVDLECLDLLVTGGPATAGQLGQRTGLSSGAVTGLIDRLERARFVRRKSDRNDRRKVLVEVRAERMEVLDAMFRPMNQAMTALLKQYSPEQLSEFADFLERASNASTECLSKLSQTKARTKTR